MNTNDKNIFSDWQNRRSLNKIDQNKNHYSIEIVNKGEDLIYKDIENEFTLQVSFSPFTSFNIYGLTQNFRNNSFTKEFWVVLERIIKYLITSSQQVYVECNNIQSAEHIHHYLANKKIVELENWNIKLLDKKILINFI
ncbi:MAG: hypothetical protein SFU98_19035 [Leptospiraceae bacterium]|nr:hypothetical protein [Leptospiraceae bacterium]